MGLARFTTRPLTARTVSLPMFLSMPGVGEGLVDHDLQQAFAVAQVDEGQAAQLAHVVHPAVDGDGLAGMLLADGAAVNFPFQ